MKFLNTIVLWGLTMLPIVGCSKKANESAEQINKVYDFEIKDLQKVKFHFSQITNNLTQVEIQKAFNIDINEKLPELKKLKDFSLQFTQEFYNDKKKQNKIRQLITKHGTKIENKKTPIWIINKKITIKAKGTEMFDLDDHKNNTVNYVLRDVFEFEIENFNN
ncbi:hypothetical protein [Spiroplasma endosymbiont of Clivina fossor]|uniref:hypothetical protein n=1 Tax=Spiroplasma endosymbiont of Clivina fossor TaxID=3066282 RepID=UPI00313B32DA